ncbi:MAG: hypothetical protein ACPHY8_01785 [Patescibacteria group bacterium]
MFPLVGTFEFESSSELSSSSSFPAFIYESPLFKTYQSSFLKTSSICSFCAFKSKSASLALIVVIETFSHGRTNVFCPTKFSTSTNPEIT